MQSINSKLNYLLFFASLFSCCLFSVRMILSAYSTIVIAVMLIICIITTVKSIISFPVTECSVQKRYYLLFLIMAVYMALMGIFNSLVYSRTEMRYYLLDASTMLFIAASINYCAKKFDPRKLIGIALVVCGIFGAVCGIISAANANWNITDSRDTNVFDFQYHIWNMLFIWPYLILWVMLDDRKKSKWIYALIVVCAAEYLILGLLYQKRVIFFEIIGIALTLVICNRKKLKKIFKYILLVAAFFFLFFFIVENLLHLDILHMIQNVLSRFVNTDISSYDRIREFVNLFKQYSPVSVAFGLGFGSVQDGPGYGNIHIGWLNYLFKGGFFLAALHLSLFIKAIRLMLKSTKGFSLFVSAACVYYYFIIATLSAWFPSGVLVIISVLQFTMLGMYEKRFRSGNSGRKASNAAVLRESVSDNTADV